MRFLFRMIVELLKLFNPLYWVTRHTDPKDIEEGDARKLLDVLKGDNDDE